MSEFIVRDKPSINPMVEQSSTPWGEEQVLVIASGSFMMKKLFLRKGCKGGLQYHREKNEAGFIVKGSIILRSIGDDGLLTEMILEAGDWFHFPSGVVHQEEALEDTEIIEVGNPIFNDRVRVECAFSLDGTDYGLPTTDESSIVRR